MQRTHRVYTHTDPDDGPKGRSVDTKYCRGLFAVSGKRMVDSLTGEASPHSYRVTHVPSGYGLGVGGSTIAKASEAAKFMDAHARTAGAFCLFGEAPSGDDLALLHSAHVAWLKGA